MVFGSVNLARRLHDVYFVFIILADESELFWLSALGKVLLARGG
jgi:hypothetical protein